MNVLSVHPSAIHGLAICAWVSDLVMLELPRAPAPDCRLPICHAREGPNAVRPYRSRVSPIRYLSMPRAALRPSEIAHTTNDWPRRMSPAAKTPGTEVM